MDMLLYLVMFVFMCEDIGCCVCWCKLVVYNEARKSRADAS